MSTIADDARALLPGRDTVPAPAPACELPPALPRDVWSVWWPLAVSWIFMGLELPAVSAAMARMPLATVSLAAYGGVVFPLSLLIESPILMLLSASTALSKDLRSHRFLERYMWSAGTALVALHALLAFTPLFDLVVGRVLGVPVEVREPARIGLRIMTPWSLSIAYRRFHQGLLIRNGRSRFVGLGTAVRLGANLVVLVGGALYGKLPGIIVGTIAVTAGVVSEAVFAGFAAQPVIRGPLARAQPVDPPLTRPRFVRFYLPLLLTPLITFLAMPLTSAAVSRMPRALESLAAWPAFSGFVFCMRSVAFALNEVVVSMLERPGSWPALKRFTIALSLVTSSVIALLAFSPLGGLWFGGVAGLPPPLAQFARIGLLLVLPAPALAAGQSLYQGGLVHAHRTRGVTEAVVAMLVVTTLVLVVGVAYGRLPGFYVAVVAFTLGNVAQYLWLARRASSVAGLGTPHGVAG
jgi:hypothetical protein